jgi:hypothetical protein
VVASFPSLLVIRREANAGGDAASRVETRGFATAGDRADTGIDEGEP